MKIYACLLIGIVTFNLLRLQEAKRKKKVSFNWMVFFTQNIIPSLIAASSGMLFIINKEATEYWVRMVFEKFQLDGVVVGMYGITADVVLKKVLGLIKQLINKITNVSGNKDN